MRAGRERGLPVRGAQQARPGGNFRARSRARASRPDPARSGWFAWLRPAFAAPALALLLAVAGYQTLVNSKLQSELRQPPVLPAVSVNVGTWGGGTSTAVPEGQGLLLLVRIPPDRAFVRYTAEVHRPGGKLEGSFTITPVAGQDMWSVTIPRITREAGTYTMAVHGVTLAGETKDLEPTTFQLQIQR